MEKHQLDAVGGTTETGQVEPEPLGLAVFDSLRTESEPWLEKCFVQPSIFDRVAGERSVVVFGRPGSGKSALCAMLARHARDNQRLPVYWSPLSIVTHTPPTSPEYIAQILEACAIALVKELAGTPAPWFKASSWLHQLLPWFVHTFVQGDLTIRFGHLVEESSPCPGTGVIQEILDADPEELFSPHNIRLIMPELVKALGALGLQGIWVLADPGATTGESQTALTRMVKDILSILPLFEQERFTYKWFLPTRSEEQVVQASSIERRRLDPHHLSWSPQQLREIAERRLSLATGGELSRLAQLCATPEFPLWLEKVGGTLPRAWLDQVQPVMERYINSNLDAPVDEKVWKQLRQHHPPRLFLDGKSGQIFLGGREIPLADISHQSYTFLKYLYQNANRVVSRAELYYRVYLGQDTIPRGSMDDGYRGPAEYRSIIDTILWRLRKEIEPDPSHPVLLRTVRGHGVRLERRW